MARKPRIWYPGATYHIISRGNRRTSLFYDEKDRLTYFTYFEQARSTYPCILHSYCLMTNHIHLQIETIDHHIKDIMHSLNSRYAIYFNKKHCLDGHLFQGRYTAKIIKSIDYFLTVSKYIHLNPVEAGIVKAPEAYKWSSYSAYITSQENPHIDKTRTLSYLKSMTNQSYREFVEEEEEEEEL